MNIHEFASRLLFSPKIEDKLFLPNQLEDEGRGSDFEVPDLPGRSEELKFSRKGQPFQFSEFKGLRNDEERGRCLHFFANHELQAIELMALALLKFPDAPNGLRRQLVSAIQDEQKHTQLYMKRMKQCGIALGDDSLNSFFWDALSSVTSMNSFLAGMSLTLEQANLDFASDFEKRFARVGDDETSKVLNIVLLDEMKHVRLGVEHFKKHHADDKGRFWSKYCDFVEPPLYPSRAKAQPFQNSVRRDIGFHEDDIEALLNYQRSKGRPPEVFFYNTFEHDLLKLKNKANASEALNRDFQYLPLWLCKENDVLVVDRAPDESWLKHLRDANVLLPEIKQVSNRQQFDLAELGHKHITRINPWAHDPSLLDYIKEWNQACFKPIDITPYAESFVELDSKKQSYDWLQKFYEQCDDPRFGNPKHSLGLWIEQEADLANAIEEVHGWGYHDVILKANYGCAGQSSKKASLGPSKLELPTRWVNEVLECEKGIWVQPCFKRVEDLSLTGTIKNGSFNFDDLNHPITNLNGRHLGHFLKGSWGHCNTKIRRFLLGGEMPLIDFWKQICGSVLAPDVNFFYPSQNFGIDAFVYINVNNELNLFPFLELNARTTFGHLAAKISKNIAPNSVGVFWLNPISKGARINLGSSQQLIKTEGGKWREGVVYLTNPTECEHIQALCTVGVNFDFCYDLLLSLVSSGDEQKSRVLTPLLSRLKMDSHTSQ